MIGEVIEKFWKDTKGTPIWSFLGIKQNSWSGCKKRGIPLKYIRMICDELDILFSTDEEISISVIKKYYKK